MGVFAVYNDNVGFVVYHRRFKEMSMNPDKISPLRFSGIYHKHADLYGLYVPDERNADAEAKICLNCPNTSCKGSCKRYKEEHKILRGK